MFSPAEIEREKTRFHANKMTMLRDLRGWISAGGERRDIVNAIRALVDDVRKLVPPESQQVEGRKHG